MKKVRKKDIEPTVTQNSALYFAQHKVSKGRSALFQKLRAVGTNQPLDAESQLTFGKLLINQRPYQDNGG